MRDFPPEKTKRVQEGIGRLAIEASLLDLDGFIEVAGNVSSPQAAAAGVNVQAINSAAMWSELALLLKPFRDRVLTMVEAIRSEREGLDEDLAPEGCQCPVCGEARVDMLAINDDDIVECASCGVRYRMPV